MIILKKNPTRIISLIETCPVANETALGGVAVGSIKAILALIVTGIITCITSSPLALAKVKKIGNAAIVIAVLLVISVATFINMIAKTIKIHG